MTLEERLHAFSFFFFLIKGQPFISDPPPIAGASGSLAYVANLAVSSTVEASAQDSGNVKTRIRIRGRG